MKHWNWNGVKEWRVCSVRNSSFSLPFFYAASSNRLFPADNISKHSGGGFLPLDASNGFRCLLVFLLKILVISKGLCETAVTDEWRDGDWRRQREYDERRERGDRDGGRRSGSVMQ